MTTQSKWVLEDDTNKIVRASTIKPRIDYACDVTDKLLEFLVQKKLDMNRSNLDLYERSDGSKESIRALEDKVRCELEIAYAVESLRQVRRCLDSIAGMGNVPTILSPAISIVRVIRSRMFALAPVLDFQLGDLSLLLSGVVVDAAHLASSSIDFERANNESRKLLERAKLNADAKIGKQFHNLDL